MSTAQIRKVKNPLAIETQWFGYFLVFYTYMEGKYRCPECYKKYRRKFKTEKQREYRSK